MAKDKKKSRKKLFIFGGLALLIIVIVIISIVQGSKEEVITVQTEKVIKRTITQTVTATGTIDPEFKVVITPEVTGEIVSLPVKEGQLVKRGELLVKIKQDVYLASKQRAEANWRSSKSNLTMKKAELEKVTLDYNRIKELHAKKLVSDQELETAKSNFLITTASVESAEAQVMQAEASVKESNEQLYKTTITAPIDGIVTSLNVELGERVLGSGFSQGTNMMTVADLSKMVAILDVDENDIVLVKMGDTARVKIDAFGDEKFSGLVYQIGNSAIQKGSGTQDQVINFEVRIRLFDQGKTLRPGMSCNSTIETQTKENVLAVPIPSVTTRQEEMKKQEEEQPGIQAKQVEKKKQSKPAEIVFVVQGSKAKSKPVKTGISDDNYIEVAEGVAEGDEVVSGSYRAISRELNDGAIVRVDNKKGRGGKDAEKK
jgi:HlyD family secretion protein